MNLNILKKSLKNYLSTEITIYNQLKSNDEFLTFYSLQIKNNNMDKDNLLKLFYFNRFFSLIFQDEIKSKIINDKPLNEDKNFINNVEDLFTNQIFFEISENKILYKYLDFFSHYGSFRKSLLYKLLEKYKEKYNIITNKNFQSQLMKLFMIQNFNHNWEEYFHQNIFDIAEKNRLSRLEFFLLFHFHEKYKNNESFNIKRLKYNINRNPLISDKDELILTITKTQINIKKYLNKLKLKYIEEFQEDGFSYDYFLPDFNIVLEFDGPVHFYPLQSQYLDWHKFRYRMINDLFKRRVVYIPYFEWMQLETENFNLEYLKKLIFLNWDYKETNCFKESYDISNIQRKFMKI